MDLDAFVAVRAPAWDRLDRLSRRRRRLTGAEVDELVALYTAAATDLSVLRSGAPDPAVLARLSATVAWGRAAVLGGQEPLWREVARLFTVSFPAAVWRVRWWAGAAAGLTVAVGLAVGVWTAGDLRVQLAALGSQAEIRRLVDVDFARYYSEHPASSFALQVWTNNAWVAATCVALGITGVGVLLVIVQNALNIGVVGGVMAANDRLGVFFGLILPHGLLELTAVFVAAGAGWRLFWALVDPGPAPRGEALAREGRAMVTVALGLVVVLAVSGVVEAFVTPSPLPTWARIGVGVLVWAAFLAYVAVFGRRAARAGETGDLAAGLREDVTPVAG